MSNMQKEPDIIYEDNDIILCHKPAGIATQTKRLGQQDMESLLKNYRAKKGELPYIGIVHRLDQPVEGIMVFAKNPKATASLSKQIQQRILGKYYYAVSSYVPTQSQGMLENYLLTDKKMNVTQVVELKADVCPNEKLYLTSSKACCVDAATKEDLGSEIYTETQKRASVNLPKEVKNAKLEYKAVDEKEGKTLFDIRLHTGRQHQIRVQMAHMGCPLVGDSKYGDGQTKDGLGLCSYKLEFQHPSTGKEMQFSIVPKGAAFQAFLEKVGC